MKTKKLHSTWFHLLPLLVFFSLCATRVGAQASQEYVLKFDASVPEEFFVETKVISYGQGVRQHDGALNYNLRANIEKEADGSRIARIKKNALRSPKAYWIFGTNLTEDLTGVVTFQDGAQDTDTIYVNPAEGKRRILFAPALDKEGNEMNSNIVIASDYKFRQTELSVGVGKRVPFYAPLNKAMLYITYADTYIGHADSIKVTASMPETLQTDFRNAKEVHLKFIGKDGQKGGTYPAWVFYYRWPIVDETEEITSIYHSDMSTGHGNFREQKLFNDNYCYALPCESYHGWSLENNWYFNFKVEDNKEEVQEVTIDYTQFNYFLLKVPSGTLPPYYTFNNPAGHYNEYGTAFTLTFDLDYKGTGFGGYQFQLLSSADGYDTYRIEADPIYTSVSFPAWEAIGEKFPARTLELKKGEAPVIEYKKSLPSVYVEMIVPQFFVNQLRYEKMCTSQEAQVSFAIDDINLSRAESDTARFYATATEAFAPDTTYAHLLPGEHKYTLGFEKGTFTVPSGVSTHTVKWDEEDFAAVYYSVIHTELPEEAYSYEYKIEGNLPVNTIPTEEANQTAGIALIKKSDAGKAIKAYAPLDVFSGCIKEFFTPERGIVDLTFNLKETDLPDYNTLKLGGGMSKNLLAIDVLECYDSPLFMQYENPITAPFGTRLRLFTTEKNIVRPIDFTLTKDTTMTYSETTKNASFFHGETADKPALHVKTGENEYGLPIYAVNENQPGTFRIYMTDWPYGGEYEVINTSRVNQHYNRIPLPVGFSYKAVSTDGEEMRFKVTEDFDVSHLDFLTPPTGIDVITNSGKQPSGIYAPDGRRLKEPVRGLNIIRTKEGKVQKIWRK